MVVAYIARIAWIAFWPLLIVAVLAVMTAADSRTSDLPKVGNTPLKVGNQPAAPPADHLPI